MKSAKDYIRFTSLVGMTLFALGWIVISAASQSPPANQQRPRTVGGNQNSSQPANQQQSNSSGEEVDEGVCVGVEPHPVPVPAAVTDKSGRPLASLRQDNFVVLEDGQPQRLTNFATTEAPFEIALLLDTSGSTREELGLIRDAANAFLNALRPGDRIAIVAFNNEQVNGGSSAKVEVLSPLTDKRSVLRTAIDNVRTSNGTPYYDALQQIGDGIFKEPPTDQFRGRRAVRSEEHTS